MFIKTSPNEYGTSTSSFKCDTCGEEYTITPAPKEVDNWQNCMSEECDSYDPKRDADVLFCSDKELQEKSIVDINKLRQRRLVQG